MGAANLNPKAQCTCSINDNLFTAYRLDHLLFGRSAVGRSTNYMIFYFVTATMTLWILHYSKCQLMSRRSRSGDRLTSIALSARTLASRLWTLAAREVGERGHYWPRAAAWTRRRGIERWTTNSCVPVQCTLWPKGEEIRNWLPSLHCLSHPTSESDASHYFPEIVYHSFLTHGCIIHYWYHCIRDMTSTGTCLFSSDRFQPSQVKLARAGRDRVTVEPNFRPTEQQNPLLSSLFAKMVKAMVYYYTTPLVSRLLARHHWHTHVRKIFTSRIQYSTVQYSEFTSTGSAVQVLFLYITL